jgi:hypothetical protein
MTYAGGMFIAVLCAMALIVIAFVAFKVTYKNMKIWRHPESEKIVWPAMRAVCAAIVMPGALSGVLIDTSIVLVV